MTPPASHHPLKRNDWEGIPRRYNLNGYWIWRNSYISAAIWCWEKKKLYDFLPFYDMIHWNHYMNLAHMVPFDTSSPWWRQHSQVNSVTKAPFRQMMGGNSGQYSHKPHLNVSETSPNDRNYPLTLRNTSFLLADFEYFLHPYLRGIHLYVGWIGMMICDFSIMRLMQISAFSFLNLHTPHDKLTKRDKREIFRIFIV